jgi:hypothetical protein
MVKEGLEDARAHWVACRKDEGALIGSSPFLVAAFPPRWIQAVIKMFERSLDFSATGNI